MVTYFSEKLSDPILNYFTYDKELYALDVWKHGSIICGPKSLLFIRVMNL
jgi:hypothetical protein